MDLCSLNQRHRVKWAGRSRYVRTETIITQLQGTSLHLHQLLSISLEIQISAFISVYFVVYGGCSVDDIFRKPKYHISASGNRNFLRMKFKGVIRSAEFPV
jgi:hypothetical protein